MTYGATYTRERAAFYATFARKCAAFWTTNTIVTLTYRAWSIAARYCANCATCV